jgi:hypothetical protein
LPYCTGYNLHYHIVSPLLQTILLLHAHVNFGSSLLSKVFLASLNTLHFQVHFVTCLSFINMPTGILTETSVKYINEFGSKCYLGIESSNHKYYID